MRDENPINIRMGDGRGHDLPCGTFAAVKEPRRRLLAVGVQPQRDAGRISIYAWSSRARS
tara:strand:+ start:294 stop:473 length:180 start_codon:yes stop_codon:yes gene_type:complete